MEGRARAAALYPQELCGIICRATFEQAKAIAGDMLCIQWVGDVGDDHAGKVALEEPQ